MSMRIIRTVLLLTAAFTPAFGQLPVRLQVDIPFDFTVGNTTLPAGTYTINSVTSGLNAVLFDTKLLPGQPVKQQAVFALAMSAERYNFAEPTVVFTHYRNDRYFVSKIWAGRNGVEFRRSREEVVTSKLVASAKPETVVLMARVVNR